MAEEIELKFVVEDYEEIVGKILKLGEFVKSAYELTVMYDDSEKSLFKRDARLRLRRIIDLQTKKEECEISHKKPKTREGIKIEEESETKVQSYEEMEEILIKLGYGKVSSYERIRDTFDIENCKVTVDSFSFGDYLEIEGEIEMIRGVAKELGFEFEKNITKSCDDIYAEICKGKGEKIDEHIRFDGKEDLKEKEEQRNFFMII